MTTCTTPSCGADYDETNAEELKRHTQPVECLQTTRCRRCYGRPSCYYCEGCFCFCTSH
ncbi:hypothetical protein LT966_22025 [Streptomyces griseobrunneus]|uniref:hypothetical protein n=1 Tax=Streptomyces griseus TaxID=1911 RepID=UPI00340739C1